MKSYFIFSIFLILAFQSFSQQRSELPSEIFTETSAPTGEIRFPAEFEPVQAVIVVYPLDLPWELIREMAEDCKVITLVNERKNSSTIEGATTDFINNGVNIDNCEFISAGINSHWIRDFGPWYIFEDNKPAIVDNIYNRSFVDGNGDAIVNPTYNNTRWRDDTISRIFASKYHNDTIPMYGMKVVHTGGNMMQDGRGIGVSDSIVITESVTFTGISADDVHQKMNDYLGIDTYHVTVDPQGDYIAHVDCWGKFLSPDKILIAKVSETHERYEKYEEVATYFENTNCCWGYPYKVYRVDVPDDKVAPYTNSLIINKKVFVPISSYSGDTDANEAAIKVYEEAMPGYEIIGMDYILSDEYGPYGSGWKNTDALHCRTRDVMDFNMLFVDHRDVLFGEKGYKEQFPVKAKFIAYSGDDLIAEKLLVHYSINDGEYQTSVMNATANANEYKGYISGCAVGDNVKYYVTGEDASGRTCVQPYFGKLEPHSFTVVESNGEEEEEDEVTYENFATFTGSGDWNSATNWGDFEVPADNADVLIKGDVTITSGSTVTVNEIIIDGGNLTIEDGAQFVHNTESVIATVEKDITGYSTDNKWHTISSPLKGKTNIDKVTGLTSPEYDLYYYDEPTYYWMNHKDLSNNFTTLDEGRGYLYANSEDITLLFTGALNNSNVEYRFSTDGDKLTGFHLIGNPYTHDIYMDNNIVTDLSERKSRGNMTVDFVVGDTGGDWWNGGNGNYHYLTLYYSDGTSEEITFKWDGDDSETSRTITKSMDSAEEFYVTFTGYKWTSECTLQILIDGNEVFNKDGEYFGAYSDTDGDATGNTAEIYRYSPNSNGNDDTSDKILCDGFYSLSGEGAWSASPSSNATAIKPCQGILVKALKTSSITIVKSNETPKTRSVTPTLAIKVENESYNDKAYVIFKKGAGLNKIKHMNEDIPMLYVSDKEENYAVATMNRNVSSIDLGFKAMTMGTYTISANTTDYKFSSMTLIDKLTGTKTNLLSDSYTFMATTNDETDRFVITLNDDTDNSAFIIHNNDKLIISNIKGHGTLHIYDIMGRVVATYEASNSVNIPTETFSDGTYIVRMTDDNGVKTQKITINN